MLLEIKTIKADSVLLLHPAFSLECRCISWNSGSYFGSGDDLENCGQVLIAEHNNVPQNLVGLKHR